MSTFLLVHGSMAGGWTWNHVRPLLEDAGHRVIAPTLTGMGDRAHLATPDTNLSTNIDDIAALLASESLTDVVLVGHSYGGMVISGVISDRVAQRVYVDAFLPVEGESAWDIFPWQREVFDAMRLPDLPWLVKAPDVAAFFPDLTPEQAAEFTSMPSATHEEVLSAVARRDSSTATFIASTTPAHFQSQAERAREEGIRVVSIAAGHMSPLTHPEQIASVLLPVAATT